MRKGRRKEVTDHLGCCLTAVVWPIARQVCEVTYARMRRVANAGRRRDVDIGDLARQRRLTSERVLAFAVYLETVGFGDLRMMSMDSADESGLAAVWENRKQMHRVCGS